MTDSSENEIAIRSISPSEASTCKKVLIDVRTPAEFEEAHIEGSILQPLTDLSIDEIKKLVSEGDGCVLVCKSGKRARMAADKLCAAGMKDICILDGGVLGWEKAGLLLKHGKETMSIERQGRIVAGSIVLVGVILGFYVNSGFFILSGFIGAGLMFAGITDTCCLGMLLARMPWNTKGGAKTTCCSTK